MNALYLFYLYLALGLATGLAFVSVGVTRVLRPITVTIGARILLLPAAIVLWPYILLRWMKAGGRQ
jgi:hypothetical protein